jgi:hypothetical protein
MDKVSHGLENFEVVREMAPMQTGAAGSSRSALTIVSLTHAHLHV